MLLLLFSQVAVAQDVFDYPGRPLAQPEQRPADAESLFEAVPKAAAGQPPPAEPKSRNWETSFSPFVFSGDDLSVVGGTYALGVSKEIGGAIKWRMEPSVRAGVTDYDVPDAWRVDLAMRLVPVPPPDSRAEIGLSPSISISTGDAVTAGFGAALVSRLKSIPPGWEVRFSVGPTFAPDSECVYALGYSASVAPGLIVAVGRRSVSLSTALAARAATLTTPGTVSVAPDLVFNTNTGHKFGVSMRNNIAPTSGSPTASFRYQVAF